MNTILSKILTEEATLFFKFLQENKIIELYLSNKINKDSKAHIKTFI